MEAEQADRQKEKEGLSLSLRSLPPSLRKKLGRLSGIRVS